MLKDKYDFDEFDFDAAYKIYFQYKTKNLGKILVGTVLLFIFLIWLIVKLSFSYIIGTAILIGGIAMGLRIIIEDYYFRYWNRLEDEDKIELYMRLTDPSIDSKYKSKRGINKKAVYGSFILIILFVLSKILNIDFFDFMGYFIGIVVAVIMLLSIFSNKKFIGGNFELKKNSKTLAYILRHNPGSVDAVLDKNGWCNVSSLEKLFTIKELENIVGSDSKGRYEFNGDKTKIRAVYGHSVSVEIEHKCITPPEVLYHGTAEKYKSNIEKEGLQPRSRLFVHLSENEETAFSVGKRHGEPIIYKINCKKMIDDGFLFYRVGNGIWLVNSVPKEYLEMIEG